MIFSMRACGIAQVAPSAISNLQRNGFWLPRPGKLGCILGCFSDLGKAGGGRSKKCLGILNRLGAADDGDLDAIPEVNLQWPGSNRPRRGSG